MNKVGITILSFFILFVINACNIEDESNLQPDTQNSYLKIIQGQGNDEPLSINEYNGDLLIVSNTTIVQGVNTSNRVRVLRVDLNGQVIAGLDKNLPVNSDKNWIAKDVLIIDNERILIGGSVGDNDSLFFLEINAQLDSVQTQFYSSNLDQYHLTGISYDQTTSKVYFGGSERTENGSEENTIFGELNAENLSIDHIYKADKARALPATPIVEDANGGLIWAYNNMQNSVVVRSPNKEMQQIDDIDDLNFDNGTNIVTKKLFEKSDGQIVILGEVDVDNRRLLFFYEVYSGDDPVKFGEIGRNRLNGVKQMEDGYLVVGSTEVSEGGAGDQLDFFISRRGPNGSDRGTESFGSGADEELHDAVMVNDHIYSIGSTVIGIENTLLLIKTDRFGKLVN